MKNKTSLFAQEDIQMLEGAPQVTDKQLKEYLIKNEYCNNKGIVTKNNDKKIKEFEEVMKVGGDYVEKVVSGKIPSEVWQVLNGNYENMYREVYYKEHSTYARLKRRNVIPSDGMVKIMTRLRKEMIMLFNPLIQKLDTILELEVSTMLAIEQMELLNLYGNSVLKEVITIIERSINQTEPLEPEYESFSELVRKNNEGLLDALINKETYKEVTRVNKWYENAMTGNNLPFNERGAMLNRYFKEMRYLKEKLYEVAREYDIVSTQEFKTILNNWGY